jgi:hypothetical protein
LDPERAANGSAQEHQVGVVRHRNNDRGGFCGRAPDQRDGLGVGSLVYGFVATYEIWGGVGVFIGLILGIVGIVPLGIIAALSHAEWVIIMPIRRVQNV